MKIQKFDVENTRRVLYGFRWLFGLFGFLKMKEGLSIHRQYFIFRTI